MCSILNNGVSKNCTCKLAHLCKRRRKLETDESVQVDLKKLLIMVTVPSSLPFHHGLILNQIHTKESHHI